MVDVAKRSSYSGFAEGVNIRGIPLLVANPGEVFWVDSGSSKAVNARGTFQNPCATIAAALDLCTASRGDIIVCKAGHSETLTTTDSYDVIGVTIVGLGAGSLMATVIIDMATGSDNGIEISADNFSIYNMKFRAETATASKTRGIVMSAHYTTFQNCVFWHGSNCTVLMRHDVDKGRGFAFINNEVRGMKAGPDQAIAFTNLHYGVRLEGNLWDYSQAAGCDLGLITFSSGIGQGHLIKDEIVLGLGNGEPYLLQTAAQTKSMMTNVKSVGADATDNIAASPASGFGFLYNFATEDAASAPIPEGTADGKSNKWWLAAYPMTVSPDHG
jgi:hypothetical protein